MAAKKKPATKQDLTYDEAKSAHAPSVRVFTQWTPAMIRSAERVAEAGDLSQAVLICEWLLTDDRITSALDARVDALLGLDVTFEPGKGRKSRLAVKALEAGEDWWEAYPESELRQVLLWGLLLGVAPAQHRWTERADHGGRVLPMPQLWHPQTLRWSWQYRKWTVRPDAGTQIDVVPGDGRWILHTPFGAERPWAYGLWRSLSRWVLLKQLAVSDWSRHSEKASALVATAPPGATAKQRQELAEDLTRLSLDAVCALAAGFDLKMVEVSANTQAIYAGQITAADNAIAIRIRGGNLTTSVDGGGSRAAAEVQASTGDAVKLRFDAASLATTLGTQSLPWWAELNFADQSVAPWPVWPVEPEEDKTKRATMVSTLSDGLTKLDALGFEIDTKKLTEEFGLDFIVGRKEPEAAPAPEPGAVVPPKPTGKPAKDEPVERAEMRGETGHIDGMLYVLDVEDSATAAAKRALRTTLMDDIREIVANGSDLESIRNAVLAKYRDAASPERLREITRAALVMGELAGTLSVHQDSDAR